MINKKDLRYVKTERLIVETYLDLKKKTDKPIKVSELCEKALINKTTFYTHYDTIEDLHKKICCGVVDKMLDNCPYIDSVFTNTPEFVTSLIKAIKDNAKLIKILFGNDNNQQTNYFEEGLLKRYLANNQSQEMETKIKFAIGGASRLLLENQSDTHVQMTIKLINQIL